jgi:hypothetical protein
MASCGVWWRNPSSRERFFCGHARLGHEFVKGVFEILVFHPDMF